MARLQERARRLSTVTLRRLGQEIIIMRPDGTEAINQFGKKDDTDVTYTEITRDEWGALYEELKQRMTATGGRTTQHNPRVALAWDTEAQVGDRLDFEDGDSYFVEDITNRDMYQVATVTLDGQN